jgi:hypothetical protein
VRVKFGAAASEETIRIAGAYWVARLKRAMTAEAA